MKKQRAVATTSIRGTRLDRIHVKRVKLGAFPGTAVIAMGGTLHNLRRLGEKTLHVRFPAPSWVRTADDRRRETRIALGRCLTDSATPNFVLWFPGIPYTISEIATVSHEAVHAANSVLAWMGYETKAARTDGAPNDEPQAYLVDFIVKETLRFGMQIEERWSRKRKG